MVSKIGAGSEGLLILNRAGLVRRDLAFPIKNKIYS